MSRALFLASTFIVGLGTQSCSTGLLNRLNIKSPVSQKPAVAEPVKKGLGASIFALDENTFRFHLSFTKVWNSALDVLLENYNLNIVDRRSGIVTTEWDTFYLDNKVYRNKVSLRIKKLAYNMVDVTIHNSVESLPANNTGPMAGVWLPHPKNKQEMGRLIHNMAINLDQPKPTLPHEMIATSGESKNETVK